MKNYDKNSLTGFVLMAIILIVFNFFFFPEPVEQEISKNSISNEVKEDRQVNQNIVTSNIKNNVTYNDEDTQLKYGSLAHTANGEINNYFLENEKLKISISNKGGRINSVIVKEGSGGKKFSTYDNRELEIFNSDSSSFNLNFSTGISINSKDLFFKVVESSSKKITMRLEISSRNYVDFIYNLGNEYLVDFDINLVGMNEIIPSSLNFMNLDWQMKTPQTEKSKTNQDMYTGIQYQYLVDKEVDYLSFTKTDEDEINSKISWVAFKQQFFSSILISKNGFDKPTVLKSEKNENSDYIKDLSAKFELPFSHSRNETINFQFFFGPNHYKTLLSYGKGFEELVPLGWGIFGWVNKYVIIEIFDFLSNYIKSYGIIILLLTLIIKLALSPFTYKAYLSQAKMKVLKPEIDKLSEKHKSKDPMKVQQETMGLYRKAGVNPMGGCLPMLFQFPILIAMFRFFPASIELRQESFLWADDLSSYDSIYNLGFEIPFYGDHVSLFTLLMTISTLLYTRMNSQMATGQMAQMKWMMYLMPVMFLGFFNNYAAGLSYYYFLANMFTFSQMYFMKKLVNEDAILAQLEANKKKPKKKSKFQKKLEDMQRKQEEQMRMRKK
jgi:YidC/Oxa1 family membrane protein insertase